MIGLLLESVSKRRRSVRDGHKVVLALRSPVHCHSRVYVRHLLYSIVVGQLVRVIRHVLDAGAQQT